MHVILVYLPSFLHRKRQERTDRSNAGHRRESLVVVQPLSHAVAFDNGPHLLPPIALHARQYIQRNRLMPFWHILLANCRSQRAILDMLLVLGDKGLHKALLVRPLQPIGSRIAAFGLINQLSRLRKRFLSLDSDTHAWRTVHIRQICQGLRRKLAHTLRSQLVIFQIISRSPPRTQRVAVRGIIIVERSRLSQKWRPQLPH